MIHMNARIGGGGLIGTHTIRFGLVTTYCWPLRELDELCTSRINTNDTMLGLLRFIEQYFEDLLSPSYLISYHLSNLSCLIYSTRTLEDVKDHQRHKIQDINYMGKQMS